MKILQLVQKPQLRGAEIFTSQLSTHLNQSGHTAIIVFLYPGAAELPFEATTFHLNSKVERRYSDFKAWRSLATIIKTEQPDIIQANAGDTLKYAVFSKLFFGWKQPIIFRNASMISLYIKHRWTKKWNSFFFKHANKIVSVSEASAKDFASLFPKYKSKITTIPIGIELGAYGKMKKTPLNAGNFKLGPVLVQVGGFTYEKNHEGLLSIFERVLKILPNAQLHLVGDGPLRSKTEQLVQEKGLTSNVHFFGFQKQALQYISNADALLLPSLIEGLPGVILEAFFCRTPVVAYNVGGIKEIVIHEETGHLIAKGDEEYFANAVLNTLAFSDKTQLQVNKAYELVTSNYLNTQIAQSFLNMYASVIAAAA